MGDFLSIYFSFDAALAEAIWALIMAGVIRFGLWVFGFYPRRGEFLYMTFAFSSLLLLMFAYKYVNWSFMPKPDLRVAIGRINVSPVPEEPSSTYVVLEVIVVNSGAPSIAEEWQVFVQISGQQELLSAKPLIIPEVLILTGDTGTVKYYGEDALYAKTVTQPIPSGGRVAGILWGKVENVQSRIVSHPETQVLVKYRNVNGLQGTASSKLSSVLVSPGYLPGLRPPGK